MTDSPSQTITATRGEGMTPRQVVYTPRRYPEVASDVAPDVAPVGQAESQERAEPA